MRQLEYVHAAAASHLGNTHDSSRHAEGYDDARGLDVLACSLYSKAKQKPSRTRRPWQPRPSLVSHRRYTSS